MKLGIRGKLFVVFLALIAVCVGVAYAFLRNQLEHGVSARLHQSLSSQAALLAWQVGSLELLPDDLASWDKVADRAGVLSRVRVTLIRRDGVVVGDSEIPEGRLAELVSYAERPEVAQALRMGEGHAEGPSPEFGTTMVNVAVSTASARTRAAGGQAAASPGPFDGVVRLSVPRGDVEGALGELRRTLGFATVLALAIAVVLSTLASQLASRGMRSLVDAAARMARGDLKVRLRTPGTDEFAQLSSALDQLAESLSTTVAALSEERDRLGAILRGMQEGVLVLDSDGYVTLTNPALREMLLLGQDSVGKMVLEVLRHTELKELLDGAYHAAEPVSQVIEVSGLKPRVLLVRAAPLRTEQGGVFAVFVDITDLRRLESIRRDFVANVSHELRTPVAAIRSAAETLEVALEHDPGARKRFLPIIDRNAQRLGQLVEDLLELSRIESRELKLELQAIDLAVVVDHALGLFLERAEKRKLVIKQEVPLERFWVVGDRRALEHVLTNLIDNAVKYSTEGGTIRTWAEEHQGVTRLHVADTSQGIPARHLPRIFERFYRVDPGRSRELGGTGLGLAIVKHMVEAMKGTVSVQSEEGVGSTFTVSLRTSIPTNVVEFGRAKSA